MKRRRCATGSELGSGRGPGLGLGLALALWAAGARGDEVVVTGTRTPESSQRAAVRVDVVGRDEIERRGALSVADALATQPGVRVAPGGYGYLGGVSGVQMQGFDRDRVLILEDGERVIGDVGGAIDLASLPTTDVERIEVVTGPQSALYGASAIGGVINVLTGPPSRAGSSGRLRLERRSRGALIFQGSGALASGASWARVELGGSTQEGVEQGAGPALLLPAVRRYQAGVRAGAEVGGGWALRGRARWLREEIEGRDTRQVPGLGRYVVEQPEQNDRYAAQLVATRALPGGSGLRVAGATQSYLGQGDKRFDGSAALERRRRSYGLSSLEPSLTLADGRRTWVLGARLEAERFSQTLDKETPGATGLLREQSDEVAPVERSSGALYGQLVWRVTSAVALLPGVRHEVHSRYGHATAPRLAAAWRPWPSVQLRAGAGRGYRAPSAKELGFVFDHSFYGYRVEGNGALRPETSWGLTADGSAQLAAGVTLRGGLFANRIEQLIDLDLGHPQGTAGGVSTYTYRNRGQARTAGGQAAVQARLGRGSRVELAYDHLWTRDDEAGTPIAGRPAHALTAGLSAPLAAGLALTARWRAFSDAYVDGQNRSPGYQSFDLRLARPVWPGGEAYVGATNLLDARQDPARPGDLRPPSGRTLYLGLRADFPAEEER